MPPKRHLDYTAIRKLIADGASLREISKSFGVPYRTLASRSYREGWNVAAVRHGLPRRSQEELNQLRDRANKTFDELPAIASEVKNNFAAALLTVSRFYKTADVSLLRKDSRALLQHVYAAAKLLGFNDPKQGEANRMTINLSVLASVPALPDSKLTQQIDVEQIRLAAAPPEENPI